MKIAQELFIHRGAGRVLCDDGDDLCTRVVGGVRGLQVDSSLVCACMEPYCIQDS